MKYAYFRLADKVVETWVAQPPAGWTAPEGYAVVPEDDLPTGWRMETSTQAVRAAVTPRQIRLALIGIGVMPEAITAALSAIPDPVSRARALAEWEFATDVERNHPLIGMLGAALGQSPAQIDALFITAAGI